MIVYVTSMEDIPKNYNECKMEMCRLPLKENGYELLKKYLAKRHKDCPLMEMKEK